MNEQALVPVRSRTLLPLYVSPRIDPGAWEAAAAATDLTVVIKLTNVPDGDPDPAYPPAMSRLAAAGVRLLGHVDLGFATRPLSDLLDSVGRWAAHPVDGVFLDQAPTSPFSIGPVALAVRRARRAGLAMVLLNPGVPTDRIYRDLGVTICTFEGTWRKYQSWSGDGSYTGDVHLVHSVPPGQLDTARALLDRRGASGLVTDRTPPLPYAGLPAALRPAEVAG